MEFSRINKIVPAGGAESLPEQGWRSLIYVGAIGVAGQPLVADIKFGVQASAAESIRPGRSWSASADRLIRNVTIENPNVFDVLATFDLSDAERMDTSEISGQVQVTALPVMPPLPIATRVPLADLAIIGGAPAVLLFPIDLTRREAVYTILPTLGAAIANGIRVSSAAADATHGPYVANGGSVVDDTTAEIWVCSAGGCTVSREARF